MIIPAWLVAVMSGWKGLKGCWPAILVCGGSFAAIQFLLATFHGPALVDVLAGLGSLALLTIFLRFWRPKEIWRFPEERATGPSDEDGGTGKQITSAAGPAARSAPTARQIAYAWVPWVLLSVMISLWGWPAWKGVVDAGFLATARVACGVQTTKVVVPGLNVYRTEPAERVVPGTDRAEKALEATYDCNFFASSGSSVFLAAILAAVWLRVSPRVFAAEFWRTLVSVRWALMTIACMLALAYTMKFSGMDVTLGLAFVIPVGSIRFLPQSWAGWGSWSPVRTRRPMPCSAACSGSPPNGSDSIPC